MVVVSDVQLIAIIVCDSALVLRIFRVIAGDTVYNRKVLISVDRAVRMGCGTYALRKQNKFLAPVSPIVANTIVVPMVLFYGYGVNIPIPLQMLTVGLGEVLSCGVLGMILLFALEKYRGVIFKRHAA